MTSVIREYYHSRFPSVFSWLMWLTYSEDYIVLVGGIVSSVARVRWRRWSRLMPIYCCQRREMFVDTNKIASGGRLHGKVETIPVRGIMGAVTVAPVRYYLPGASCPFPQIVQIPALEVG